MKLLRLLGLALAVGALLVLTTEAGASGAAAAPGPAVLKISTAPSLDSKGHKIKGQLLIIATLTAADGNPLGNETVNFFEGMNFAGANREAALGTAVTDSTGVAAIAYQPAQVGKHTLIARFAGGANAAKADVTSTFQVSEVVPPFPPAAVPLKFVRRWLSVAVVTAVVAVWLFLFGVLLRTVLGIRAAGSPQVVTTEVPEYVRTSHGD